MTSTLEIKRNAPRFGFTLVELLVVIAIISLLVTLLVPSLQAFLDRGKATRTATAIRTLDSGLELHRGEPALGGDYPPSQYDITNNGTRNDTLSAYGAETLEWALAGPTLQGTAGTFPPPELQSPVPDPLPHRFGPFIDVSAARVDRSEAFSDPLLFRPTFLDDFGMPILYFRATPNTDLVYRLADNAVYLRLNVDPLYSATPQSATTDYPFYLYIRDNRVWDLTNPHQWAPHNRDKFLLISAGPDRLYGTADDICNFPFNALPKP